MLKLLKPFRKWFVAPIETWLVRAIREDNMFLLILGARWLSLIPPALLILLDPAHSPLHLLVFIAASANNILLSFFHPFLDRLLLRRPVILGVDMLLAVTFIAFTGGTASPYYLYARAPLLAAAFFFRVRGGLVAATAFTPIYLLAVWTSSRYLNGDFRITSAVSEILIFYLISFFIGYPAVLLQRMRLATLQLQSAQQQLVHAETLATMGKMTAQVSHEIRNPLATIGGFARAILRKPNDVERVQVNARIIVEEAERLEELLTDILDLARPLRLKITPVNLHEVLDKAWLLANNSERGSSRVIVRKNYAAELPSVEADGAALLRAFLNILRNAVQVMPEGGTVTITTRHNGNEAEVMVEDTGPGIPHDMLPTLFTPFVSRRANGTGIGLAVAQEIVRQHGGRIEVASDCGHGACFTFHLPLLSHAVSAPATAPSGADIAHGQ